MKSMGLVVPPVDEVGTHERADYFTKRSIKKESKIEALYLAMTMCDLTTLEGADTEGKICQMCAQGALSGSRRIFAPVCTQRKIPAVHSVGRRRFVFIRRSFRVAVVKCPCRYRCWESLSSRQHFPSGQGPMSVKIEYVRLAIEQWRNRDRHGHQPRRFFSRGNYQAGVRRNYRDQRSVRATRTSKSFWKRANSALTTASA